MLLWSLLLLCGCQFQSLPMGATVQAEGLHDIWLRFLGIGLAVALIVYGLMFWCLARYRKTEANTSYPPPFRRNNKMEIIYTIIPLVIACVLFGMTYTTESQVESLSSSPAVVVDVTGYRWSWHFTYPDLHVEIGGTTDQPPTLVLPLGETVRMNIASADVDHSFWVPAFLFKRDAIPGLKNSFDWTPKQMGSFRGECGEFCGLEHANMSFTVRVVSPADFRTWVLMSREHRS